MAAIFLGKYPELKPFQLSNVRSTGVKFGRGAYGSVKEVTIDGAICAAKKIHKIFLDPAQVPRQAIEKYSDQFAKECKMMSTIRHPHIVQFIGIYFFPGSQIPALVMERMLTSLHDLLDQEKVLNPSPDTDKSVFQLSLKCSILHDVAGGLAFLHQRSPPVVHTDLSAKNVLLTPGMVAKIGDLGMARIVPLTGMTASITPLIPGAAVYMPPEVLESESKNEQYTNCDVNIDIFSFGVVAIFTISETFPWHLPAPTYREGGRLLGRTELERRDRYMKIIYTYIRENHPLIQMIKGCLDFPEKRPSIHEVLRLIEQARAEVRNEEMDRNLLDKLVKNLHCKLRDQIRDLVPLKGLNTPYGIAFNSQGEMIVSEWGSHRVSTLNIRDMKKVKTFGSCGDLPEQMRYPAGITVNGDDNIYVTSQHKLQKFSSSGTLEKTVGKRGKSEGEFDDPRALAVYNEEIYVIDRGNNRIQVFDLNLRHQRFIGSRGREKGRFDDPFDIKFDTDGHMYIAEYRNSRVQVLNANGQHLKYFGEERLGSPTGLHIFNNRLYVSDFAHDNVVVFDTATGENVTTLAKRGTDYNELRSPYCITAHDNGESKTFLYVCDFGNNRIHVFDGDEHTPCSFHSFD